jgi:hypothetical protein
MIARTRFLKTSSPTSVEGIEKYLGSGLIRGIGPAYAKKLVQAVGETVFNTMQVDADAVYAGEKRALRRLDRQPSRSLHRDEDVSEGKPQDHRIGLPERVARRTPP